ncbi:saccharopine dehydrogenase family protein [Georgenia subflava]|uniref:Enoyl-ACP reductase n=1 Tax=Georgenia subflava TaxID=1622177 RepID=A0A6N7EH48_9MICO|nr:saccharopine dehydrogenase NADP-binding domain-containing protein [Georgenia subflava]MPV36308.1 enoyl-ACP reductase [Georgenia subflava]
MRRREHDLVVYGASGFVGKLLSAYLAETAPAGLRVALAGRSREKLAAVRAELPGAAREWPLVLADTADPGSVVALAESTRVLVTTVGPYAVLGMPVVEACARAGTHYADLSGELTFTRDAIDRTDAPARESGARIVHSCGYDSLPSDLAVLLLAEQARTDGAGELRDVRLVATSRGGVSGGTVASMRGQAAIRRRDPSARRLADDPFALSPDRPAEPDTSQPPDATLPSRTRDGRWTAPFVMAPYNTRLVRRSNALQSWSYGRGLTYGEVMGCGRGARGAATAVGMTAGLAGLLGAMRFAPSRALLDRFLPAPGTGPDHAARQSGWFRMVVEARTDLGRRYRATAAGPGDPGYAATAVMFGESALALALDGDRLPPRAGSLTPATALGDVLVRRLRAAGHAYEVVPSADPA